MNNYHDQQGDNYNAGRAQPLNYGGAGLHKKSNRKNKRRKDSDDSSENDRNFWRECPAWCKRKARYFSCCNKDRKKTFKEKEKVKLEYSSGESDSEYVQRFTYLATDEKIKRILELWMRAYRKLKACTILLDKLTDTRQRITV